MNNENLYYIEDTYGNRVFDEFPTYFYTMDEALEAADVIFYALPHRFTIGQVARPQQG